MTTYYRHSGRFAPDAPFTALVVSVPAALALSWVYAYAILYIPIIGIVTFVLTGGLGLAVGAVTGGVLRKRKVRNAVLAWAVGLSAGLLTLWFSWVSWVVGLVRRGDGEVSWLGALLSPTELWNAILKINEVGAWSFKGATPTGAVLWVLWCGEAMMIVGLVAWMSAMVVAEPFCEGCGRWTAEKKAAALSAPTDVAALKESLERKQFSAITGAGVPTDPSRFFRYDLHVCTSCGQTNTLSVVQMTQTRKGAKTETDESQLVRGLLITREEVAAVEALARASAAPAAA
jgi:hypothetical protein